MTCDSHGLLTTSSGPQPCAWPIVSPVLFVADSRTLADDDRLVQVVDLSERARRPFRCIARSLWMVENSLTVSNMDWEDFAEQTDDRGIFRGFA